MYNKHILFCKKSKKKTSCWFILNNYCARKSKSLYSMFKVDVAIDCLPLSERMVINDGDGWWWMRMCCDGFVSCYWWLWWLVLGEDVLRVVCDRRWGWELPVILMFIKYRKDFRMLYNAFNTYTINLPHDRLGKGTL